MDLIDGFTIEAWVYNHDNNPVSGIRNIITKAIDNDKHSYSTDIRTGSSKYNVWIPEGSDWNGHTSDSDITDNTWSHITVTYNKTHLIWYLNGSDDGSTTSYNHQVTTNEANLFIGCQDNGAGGRNQFWDGLIDEARISNTGRTSDWITTSYNTMTNTTTFVSFGSEQSE